MTNLFIVYGSESELLHDVFSYPDSYFIRIYNKRVPAQREDATDVNNFEDFKTEFERLFKELDVKKIIFLGAAFITQTKLLLQEDWESIENSLNANIINYVKYCHFLLPYMVQIRAGNFVYLSSFRATVSSRGISIYSSSKAFGERFFEVIGKENAAFGIYSTSIRMGYFDGRMTNLMSEDKIKKFTVSVGNRRLGNAEDLWNAIKFALENPYTNGGVIDLTGGINHE